MKNLSDDPKIQKVNEMISRNKAMLRKLKSISVKVIENEPDWPDCINMSFVDGHADLKLALINLADYLVHKNKIPIDICKNDKTIWVKTQ